MNDGVERSDSQSVDPRQSRCSSSAVRIGRWRPNSRAFRIVGSMCAFLFMLGAFLIMRSQKKGEGSKSTIFLVTGSILLSVSLATMLVTLLCGIFLSLQAEKDEEPIAARDDDFCSDEEGITRCDNIDKGQWQSNEDTQPSVPPPPSYFDLSQRQDTQQSSPSECLNYPRPASFSCSFALDTPSGVASDTTPVGVNELQALPSYQDAVCFLAQTTSERTTLSSGEASGGQHVPQEDLVQQRP